MKYLLGIDVGTTNVKCVLFDETGHMVDNCQQEYKTYFPQSGWAEQDPEDWWNAAKDVIRKIMRTHAAIKKEILAVGISSQAPSLLPVNKNGISLRKALIWMDKRSEVQCANIKNTVDEDYVLLNSGNRVDPFFILPKLLWFKEHERDLYDRTYKILQPNSYLNFKLTGQYSMDIIHATLSLMYNVNNQSWDTQMFDRYQIPIDIFPEVHECYEVLGNITKEAADSTGLDESTIVISGTVDGTAAALEAGIVDDGEAVEMTGTSSVLLMAQKRFQPNKRLTYMRHIIPGRHIIFGAMSTTGACLKWFRDQFYLGSNEKSFEMMDKEVEKNAPLPTKILFLPYLMGERSPIWDATARGMFAGITLNTTRAEILRSMMEGTAFALYDNLLEAASSGSRINQLISVGGGAQSDIWLKIKSSIIGTPICVPKASMGAPLGNAILAGYAAGIYKDIASTAKNFIKIVKTYEPVPEWHSFYKQTFCEFKKIYEETKDTMTTIAKID